jgi:hypothetical protein
MTREWKVNGDGREGEDDDSGSYRRIVSGKGKKSCSERHLVSIL